MSSRVNLNDNVKDRFEFTIGGLDYDFKYPTLEDIEPIQELVRKQNAEGKKGTPESVEEVARLDKALEARLYGLIIPVGHDTPIRETLRKQPSPVVNAFNKMIREQLAAE